MAISKDKLLELQKVHEQLESERGSWDAIWQEIIKYMGTSYGAWQNADSKDAPKYEIKDTTAGDASDILADGVEGYAFNRTTAWFSYKIKSLKEGASKRSAESLLEKVKKLAYLWLSESNFYDEAAGLIRACADLSTATMAFDFDRKRTVPVFECVHNKDTCIVTDKYGEVDTLFRHTYMTRREAASFFGEEALPKEIKDDLDQLKKWKFTKMTAPVDAWDIDIPGTGDYFEIYWYKGHDKTLLERRIPAPDFTTWRWRRQTFGGSWGVDAPGMKCLPILKFVNVLQEDVIVLSELIAKGHWKKTKGLKVNFRAGSVTELENGQDFARMQYTGDLSWLMEHITYYRQVINNAYKTDLFLILTQNIERVKTATEVSGIEAEKNSLMASFFSRLAKEFLSPVLLWLFKAVLIYGANAGLILTQDELDALKDMDIEVAFASPMFNSQQRAFELQPTITWVNDVISLSQITPAALDRVDFDKLVEMMHELTQASKDVLVDMETAKAMRDRRAQAQQAMLDAQMGMAEQEQSRKNAETEAKIAGAAGA